MPRMPTTRAPSVLGVCGWVSTPRTALPRVYCPLVCSLGVSAPPCRVVRHTTMPWSSPQSLSTRPTLALRARRGGAGRPHGPSPPPTDSRSPRRVTLLSHKRSLHPCTPPHGGQCPRARHPPNPRHDDAREVHAGRSWGGRPVRCDCPRPQRHRLGVVFASVAQYTVYPPSETYQQHALPGGGSGLWGSSCRPSACGRRSGPVPVAYGLHGRWSVAPFARRHQQAQDTMP